jgi:uncharacterized protein (TIGR03067 family)
LLAEVARVLVTYKEKPLLGNRKTVMICLQFYIAQGALAYSAEPIDPSNFIVGRWEVISEIYDGDVRENHHVYEFSPKNIVFFMRPNGQTTKSTYSLDVQKSPARISWWNDEFKFVGICKLEGGKLIICGRVVESESKDTGPKEFSSKKMSENFLSTFSRRE